METEHFEIEGPILFRPRIHADGRGRFIETWSKRAMEPYLGLHEFVQDNESRSRKGVLRGLHLQLDPNAQGKLVRVVAGAALDVFLDARTGSTTYGKHIAIRLDSDSSALLWIPPGFAHGFVALEEETVFQYKCTAPYAPESERTILWNDPVLGIDWGVEEPIVSDKDLAGIPFRGAWKEPR